MVAFRSGLQRVLLRVKQRKSEAGISRVGFSVLLRIWKLLRLLPGSQWVTVTLPVAGHRLRVRLFSYDDLLTASPGYEGVLDKWLPSPGAVAIDAGAYIGRHTLAFARAVGPHGRVVAIEPLSANFQLLEGNVVSNGYCQVHCVECALGATPGRAQLRYSRESSTATCDLRRATLAGQMRVARVPQQTLDDVLANLQIEHIDLLKIDVEGAELPVLTGAQQTLAHNPGVVLIVELHGGPSCAEPVLQWLIEHGYHVEDVSDQARRFAIARRTAPGKSRKSEKVAASGG
jgi:FkbM family methyltransferase